MAAQTSMPLWGLVPERTARVRLLRPGASPVEVPAMEIGPRFRDATTSRPGPRASEPSWPWMPRATRLPASPRFPDLQRQSSRTDSSTPPEPASRAGRCNAEASRTPLLAGMEATEAKSGRRSRMHCLPPSQKGDACARDCASLAIAAVAALLVAPIGSAHALNADTLVTVGSPSSPFSANKQNEPAVAIDANHPACSRPARTTTSTWRPATPVPDNDCPFTEGVGVLGRLLLVR